MVIPPGYGYYQLVMRCEGDDENMLTGWGIKPVSTDDEACQDIVDNYGQYAAPVTTIMSNNYTVLGAVLRVGQDGGDPRVYEHLGVGQSGDVAGKPCPPNTSWLYAKGTAQGGRRHRGRLFIPGVPAGWIGPNGVIDGATSVPVSAGEAILQVANNDHGGMWIFHSPGRTEVPEPSRVTSLTFKLKVATQRRRLRP